MKVLIARPASLSNALEEVAAAVRARGAEVRLADPAEALAQPDEWDILAGPGSMRCDAGFLAAHPRLRCVVSVGSGVEGIDLAAATSAGVLVAHGGTRENVGGMAEATVMAMLALLHDLKGAEDALRRGGPRRPAALLYGKTVGLVGNGAIGFEVARLLQPWRPRILISSPRGASDIDGGEGVDLDTLLAESDVVSLHASLNAGTRNLINRRRIEAMKPGAVLINFARGGMLDEQALADALRFGHLSGAALDVFETEPLAPDSPLRDAPNLILTPHNIGHTAEGARSVVEAVIGNIVAVLGGRAPPLLRNPGALQAWRRRPSLEQRTEEDPRFT